MSLHAILRSLLGASLLVASPGLAADRTAIASVETALDAWRMEDVEAALARLPDDATGNYIRGVVANRTNDVARSRRFLLRALPELERSQPQRAAKALFVLADDYRKASVYAAQERTLRRLIARHADRLTPEMLAGARTDLQLSGALRDAPPQTIHADRAVTLPVRRNPVGTLNVDAVANGVAAPWMLDSGANYSIVSESFAKRLGLTTTGAVSGAGSITGLAADTRVAVVKEIRLGSIVLHDVAVLVVSDQSVHIKLPSGAYQIDGALGFPVFQALGKVTFSRDATITADPTSAPMADGATLYMNELSPVVTLGVEGRMLPFSLDTGAAATDLWHTYFERFRDRASAWRHEKKSTAGLGGVREFDTVLQPALRLLVGRDEVVLHDVPIEAGSQRSNKAEAMFGNVGQDLWTNEGGFTLDLRSMRFRLEHPRG